MQTYEDKHAMLLVGNIVSEGKVPGYKEDGLFLHEMLSLYMPKDWMDAGYFYPRISFYKSWLNAPADHPSSYSVEFPNIHRARLFISRLLDIVNKGFTDRDDYVDYYSEQFEVFDEEDEMGYFFVNINATRNIEQITIYLSDVKTGQTPFSLVIYDKNKDAITRVLKIFLEELSNADNKDLW